MSAAATLTRQPSADGIYTGRGGSKSIVRLTRRGTRVRSPGLVGTITLAADSERVEVT